MKYLDGSSGTLSTNHYSLKTNIRQKYEFVILKLYNTYKHFLAAREARLEGTIGSASASSARGWEEHQILTAR